MDCWINRYPIDALAWNKSMSSQQPQKVKLTTALKSNQLDKGKVRGSKTQYYGFPLYNEEFEDIQ